MLITADQPITMNPSERCSSNPLVSVLMLAYNHEQFIDQAISGVLAQETTFPYELIIAEDCSPDDTLSRAKRAEQEYPDRVRVLANVTNLGMHENFRRGMESCVGKYIAFCEADDLWRDPAKLQKQVELLEADSECVVSFHDVIEIDDSGAQVGDSKIGRVMGGRAKDEYVGIDFLRGSFIPTLSAVIRNVPGLFRTSYFSVGNPDTYVFAMLGQYGVARRVEGELAAYRHHSGGVWSATARDKRFWLKLATFIAIANDIDCSRRAFAVRVVASLLAYLPVGLLKRHVSWNSMIFSRAVRCIGSACCRGPLRVAAGSFLALPGGILDRAMRRTRG